MAAGLERVSNGTPAQQGKDVFSAAPPSHNALLDAYSRAVITATERANDASRPSDIRIERD
jgi:hypothetical protein